jgi:beta-glucosidase/6-phospho-beta-glucosidase/beta-galactosidase
LGTSRSDYIIQLTGIEKYVLDDMEVDYQAAHLCSGELASHLGVDLQGHIHNALYDVRSIALALNQWMQKGLLKLSLFHTKSPIH